MIVHDVVQRSPEWHQLRLGKLTSSRAAAMLATTQSGGWATSRVNLLTELVLERITGTPQGSTYESRAMRDGAEREEDAASLYEAITGRILWPVGFVAHDSLPAGCSPDGRIGDDFEGGGEFKCPIPATHLEFLETGVIALKYQRQILHSLWLTGARWWDFVSYQPDFPESLRMRIKRVERDDTAIAKYDAQVRTFLREVELKVETLRTMGDPSSALRAVGAA